MKIQVPTIEQIDALATLVDRVVPAEWEDLNGHVNVRHYLDRGTWPKCTSGTA